MKLAEALRITGQRQAEDATPFSVYLVCGFTPLHLATFVAAELRKAMPARAVKVHSGLYGDLHGSLAAAPGAGASAVALAIEWEDLDPRLGLRRLGGWIPGVHADILAGVSRSLERLREGLAAASGVPAVVSLPTLPLPPVAYTARWQAGGIALELEARLAAFAASLAELTHVRVLNAARLAACSPPGSRLDVKMELAAGFPYTLGHAAELGAMLARLIHPPRPKKGLVTDLDDTLWLGILGEIGPEKIAWDLEHHAQIHGLYQQLLASLADTGVLVGVISKNDPALVAQAFERPDLVLPRERIFPVEAGWGTKSQAFTRVLQQWNIGAGDVVFIDDSPIELAEVQSVHPEAECILFEKNDAAAVYGLLGTLRDRFGRAALSEEDQLRRESLRRASENPAAAEDGKVSDEFLRQLGGEISVTLARHPVDPRAFELVNKTNQFNLNGRRYEEAEWARKLDAPGAFLAVASYRDKFGPLGKIAVMAGRQEGRTAMVDTWVMSCRAFSRRIEHACLDFLFRELDWSEAVFDFEATPRNGPSRDFLAEISGQTPRPGMRLSRATLDARRPALFHLLQRI